MHCVSHRSRYRKFGRYALFGAEEHEILLLLVFHCHWSELRIRFDVPMLVGSRLDAS